MPFNDVERGVRDLIRDILRSKGIKHRSTTTAVRTVCYAQHPLTSTEYSGPIEFTFSGASGTVIADVYGPDPDSWPMYRYKRMPATAVLKTKKFDISQPDFDTQVGQFLDENIKEHNKRPAPYKILEADDGNFVADLELTSQAIKPSRWQRLILTIKLVLGSPIPIPPDGELWMHAIRRHFKISKEEAEKVNTLSTLLRCCRCPSAT